MSVSDQEITNLGDEEEEEGEDIGVERRKKHKDEGFGCGYSRKFTKAKRVVLSAFGKSRNKEVKPKTVESISSFRKRVSSGSKGCYFCFREPEILEDKSQTSDPNDPNFTFDMLRNLLETNDFYSKECNPHLDVNVSTGSSSSSSSAAAGTN